MANSYYSGPATNHFDGERFFNPGQESTDRTSAEFMRWMLARQRVPWPKTVAPVVPVRPAARSAALRVTMVGHACVLVQLQGINLLVDPLWADRAGPRGLVGPKRVDDPGIRFDDLPPIDAVLVTHNHYDHMDAVTIRRLHKHHHPRFITPLGNDVLLRRIAKGMDVVAGDWGGSFDLAGVRVAICPAYHWSARNGRDRRMALWGGFVVSGGSDIVYVAGDTAYGDGAIFRAIRADHGAPTLAVLPIGAYEPRWFMKPQHVNPDEAVQIMRDCGAAAAIGVHWGTFQLTDEAREAPEQALAKALAVADIDPALFPAFKPGDVWQLQ